MEKKRYYAIAAFVYLAIMILTWYLNDQTIGVATKISGLIVPILAFLGKVVASEDGEDDDDTTESDGDRQIMTFEERKEQAKKKLESYYTLRESSTGEIKVCSNKKEIKGLDRSAMMWVFEKWALADTNPDYSKILTVEELRQETELKGRAVQVFLGKMEHFLIRHYPEDPEDRYEETDGELVGMDEENMEFELNEDNLEEITDYIIAKRDSPN